jgi:hypothetical protein
MVYSPEISLEIKEVLKVGKDRQPQWFTHEIKRLSTHWVAKTVRKDRQP